MGGRPMKAALHNSLIACVETCVTGHSFITATVSLPRGDH